MPNPKFSGGGKSKASVHLEGFKELQEDLAALGENIKDILDEASQAGAVIVLAAARARVPQRTGNLAANLEIKASGKKATQSVRTVGPNRNAWYGVQVELGHNVVRGDRIVAHVPARPYLRPAILDSQTQIEQAVARVAGAALDRG